LEKKAKKNMIGIRLIKSFVRAIFKRFLYFCSGLVPKKENLWVFGCWEGQKFCDNAKHLFLYVIQMHPEIKAVWITKNHKVFNGLKEEGFNVFQSLSIKGIWVACRAKVVLVTHSVHTDLNPYATRGARIINLFHTTLPIKRVGFDYYKSFPFSTRIRIDKEYVIDRTQSSYSFSSSKNVGQLMASALRIPGKNIKPVGVPRTDYLLGSIPVYGKDRIEIKNLLVNKDYDNLIYFVPTFRTNKEYDLFSFCYDAIRLNSFLEKTKSLLVFRFHPFDTAKYTKYLSGGPRIIVDTTEDVYSLLKLADILITDYSSICYDFLLFDRPMIFAQFDHKGYLKERQLYYDYDKVTPGDKASDWNEVLQCLERVVIKGEDKFKSQRAEMNKFVYECRDGRSCRRIVEFIRSLK
jgi:CDP-glycerol glycerophosphotransferase (TagB/SpsB family)